MIRLSKSTAKRAARRAVVGRPAADDGRRTNGRKGRGQHGGFTLVELMIVIVVLVILIGLLLPAINGALRTARNAAVTAEINQLAQALANFKSKYGDYPPSRFLCVENGNYQALLTGGNTALNSSGNTIYDPTSPGAGDIQSLTLVQRSIAALRKFWPRVSTAGLPSGAWYDFNGNGVQDAPYVLHGHECLVFFLGGVPLLDTSSQTYGLTGFGKDPTNPFTNMVNNGNHMYNPNRQEPFYQFNAGRLFLDPNGTSGIPGYYDTLNNGPPVTGSGTLGFYAYFSAYGNNNYDPNDVNFTYETDNMGNSPIELEFLVTFPTYSTKSWANGALSASPNPYSSSSTQPTSNTVTYQSPQTFQIISSGADGLYGVGGQYLSSQSAASEPLPFESGSTYYGGSYSHETDASIRMRERDNLTNFKQGTLQ